MKDVRVFIRNVVNGWVVENVEKGEVYIATSVQDALSQLTEIVTKEEQSTEEEPSQPTLFPVE